MHLGLHVVGDKVRSAVDGHLTCWPVGVIGQVGWKHGDTQLTLISTSLYNAHVCLYRGRA